MADTITQTPFQPLVPLNQVPFQQPDPSARGTVVPYQPELTPGQDIQPVLFGEPGARDIDRIAGVNRSVDKQIEQQGSFWPNALAIGALLTGNFGPMIQLEEQKRKTAIGQLATPYILEATDLSHQGKHEEAQNVINTAVGKFGQRAPEVMQLFKPVIEKISKDQTNWRDMQGVAKWAKMAIPDNAHPDMVNFRDFAQEAVKNRTLVSSSLLENLYTKAFPHQQMINGQALQQGGLNPAVIATPLPNVLMPKDVGGAVGELLSQRTGLQVPIINDVLNLKEGMPPVALPSGGSIAFGSPAHQRLLSEWQGQAQTRAELELTKDQPKRPEVIEGLHQEGVSNLEINTGTYPLHKLDRALLRAQADKISVASAPERVKMEQNPFVALDKNATAVNARTGLPIRSALSYDESKRLGDPILWLPNEVFKTQYAPAMEALKGFDKLEPFIESLGNPDTWGKRFDSGAFRWVTDRFGIAVAKNAEASKVLQDVLNKSIEETMSKAGVDVNDVEVGRIKALVTGIGADPAGARTAIAEMKQRIQDRILRQTGEAGLTTGGAGTPAVTNPRGGTVPVTTVAPTPAAGVTPGAQYRQPDGSFQPSGTSAFRPGKRPPGNAAQRRAVEVLKDVVPDTETPAAAVPAATPAPAAQPAQPQKKQYKFTD